MWELEDAEHKFDQHCLSFVMPFPEVSTPQMSMAEGEGLPRIEDCELIEPPVEVSPLQRRGANLRVAIKPPSPRSLCK